MASCTKYVILFDFVNVIGRLKPLSTDVVTICAVLSRAGDKQLLEVGENKITFMEAN